MICVYFKMHSIHAHEKFMHHGGRENWGVSVCGSGYSDRVLNILGNGVSSIINPHYESQSHPRLTLA